MAESESSMMYALQISACGFSCRWIQLVGVLLMNTPEVKEFVRQDKIVQASGNPKTHLFICLNFLRSVKYFSEVLPSVFITHFKAANQVVSG